MENSIVMLEGVGEDNEDDLVRDRMFGTIGSQNSVSSTFTIPRQIPRQLQIPNTSDVINDQGTPSKDRIKQIKPRL